MRFDELTIEKYGAFAEGSLSLKGQPGLVVIHGANEAGKSTWLSAIADFLYGIPHNSPYGQVFGNDQIRLGATLRLADGNQLTLRRRKGRGPTLTQADGKAVDESLLSSILGPTTRERFTTLFGLGHMALRSGGERLMQADGDIGRLVVEAGGGLRTLLTAIDTLGADAEKLFTTRKAAERAFYQAREAFEEADRSVKVNLKTREAYEQVRKLVAVAEQEHRELKDKQRRLAEQLSREQRVERVVPLLVSLDRLDKKVESFADLPSLRPDFAAAVRTALSVRDAARAAFEEAEDRWVDLDKEMEALVIPVALINAEARIRDIHERSVHVENERKSRPNRIAELVSQEAQLATLRESIGTSPDTDLAQLLPAKATIDRVQRIVSKGLELRPRIEGIRAEIETDRRALKSLEQRQTQRIDSGVDKPLGVAPTEFGLLPRLADALRTRTNEAKRIADEVQVRLRSIGFTMLEALRGFQCPDATAIQTELDRRVVYETELAKQIGIVATQTAQRESALSSIARLKEAGEVPTESAIASARAERHTAWVPIRGTFLAEDPATIPPVPLLQRQETVVHFERRIDEADQLSDRKSLEAQRITDLAAAEKLAADATAAINAATAAKEEVEARLGRFQREFAEAWPQALQVAGGLTELKTLATQRDGILGRAEEAEQIVREIGGLRADHDPRMELLVFAERLLGIGNAPTTLQARIQAVTSGIKIHDDAHAAFRFDATGIEDINDRLGLRLESLAGLERDYAEWLAEYRSAVREILLKDDTPPERAGEVVNEWSAARGVFVAIKATRKRLSQFEDDERSLAELIAATASTLDLVLPADPVAAAKMLEDRLDAARKTETRKSVLEPQLLQRARDRDMKERLLRSSEALLAALCETAGADEASVLNIADRHEALIAAETEREQVVASIMSAGDGRAIEALREEWGGRDLDGVRANTSQIRAETEQTGIDIETTLTNLQDRRRELQPFEAEAGVNAAVAERERAAAEMHQVIGRYMELTLARALLETAVSRLRSETQDPLLLRAGQLFALVTGEAFSGIGTDIDGKGFPVVIGRRDSGEEVAIERMSDGTRDQLFLACRLASILQYCDSAEPLPFIADDLLVHFDDTRSAATLRLLAEIGKTTQVLLFTHHKNVRTAVAQLADRGEAGTIDLN